VLVRNGTVKGRLPGAIREYQRRCPTGTFCADGLICRVGLMAPAAAVSSIESLTHLGADPWSPSLRRFGESGEPHFRELEPDGRMAATGRGAATGGVSQGWATATPPPR